MTFTPSTFQSAIGDFVRDPTAGNLIVEAVAGSGKTTTICWALSLLPTADPGSFFSTSSVFLAFNKSIADTLASRVPRTTVCSTFHSLGFRALKPLLNPKAKVDGAKCKKLVWNLMDREDPDVQNVIRLVSLLKSQWPAKRDKNEVLQLAHRYDLSFENESSAARIALQVLESSNRNLDVVDFDDMLWLPVLLGASFSTYDYIFVDEAQDTNDIQAEILGRLMLPKVFKPTGEVATDENGYSSAIGVYGQSPTRIFLVGDPHQAIYGFRGANADAISRLSTRFACKTLPLSVCYRCSQAVVAEAQKVLNEKI